MIESNIDYTVGNGSSGNGSSGNSIISNNSDIRRIDEMLRAESRRVNEAIEAERRRVNEQFVLRAEYDAKLAVAEAKRIDAIGAADKAQAIVLAGNVASSAATLRDLVAATAASQALQLTNSLAGIDKRLAALDEARYVTKGNSGGMRDTLGWIFGAIMLLTAIGSLLLHR